MSTKSKKKSGDPRKNLGVKKTSVVIQPVIKKTLRLKEFIKFDDRKDMSELRNEAIEMKAEKLTDEFFNSWEMYYDESEIKELTYDADPYYFFEAVLDIGEKNKFNGLNIDDIVLYLEDESKTPAHLPSHWPKRIDNKIKVEKYIEYLKNRGYMDDFDSFKNIDQYINEALDTEYDFFDNEEIKFSY
ncbi:MULTISPECIES: hypothetical protein [Rosenbergiella]|uniref:hypothetical protein n=1 Tax=Rosenbergiella TaxID=1356488 RepID=UPI001F4F7127|nr:MULTISPECIES: hypothetical protein [Rosenbergiella]